MNKVKRKMIQFGFYARSITIIALRLGMRFQPNKSSSLYKLPPRDKIPSEQRHWSSPVGTLRLSNHWSYKNYYGDIVYQTHIEVPDRAWVLCVNTGIKPKSWKVLQVFELRNCNIIKQIDLQHIHKEIDDLLISAKG